MRPSFLFVASALALAACAPVDGADIPRSSEPRACFLVQQVTSFRSDGRQRVYVRTIGDEVFRLDAIACPGLETNFQIGLEPGLGSSSRLCQGDTVRLIARGYTSDVQSCPARVGPHLTEAEVAALPARDRP
ncbi:hypothetical protein IP78_06065 [Brevundimonas sp. AAP58]|uniref:DUF6491 family protein n=1 Tax=Brevundimonas sp. AAP58 TaxID=1523422 RepID=UPI0006B9801B|nr:DUF6491 family protein [Brevundimonas sp. AAP58]KPF80995.1 hypothetical protein IP78_06065 [Brevundimonas sp. AAP58]